MFLLLSKSRAAPSFYLPNDSGAERVPGHSGRERYRHMVNSRPCVLGNLRALVSQKRKLVVREQCYSTGVTDHYLCASTCRRQLSMQPNLTCSD